jgi:hypothetical protein
LLANKEEEMRKTRKLDHLSVTVELLDDLTTKQSDREIGKNTQNDHLFTADIGGGWSPILGFLKISIFNFDVE